MDSSDEAKVQNGNDDDNDDLQCQSTCFFYYALSYNAIWADLVKIPLNIYCSYLTCQQVFSGQRSFKIHNSCMYIFF